MDIVLYMGGCCGDIVTGIIDTRGVSIITGKCILLKKRSRLKKSFEFDNDADRNAYIQDAKHHWKSIPSHDAEYHIRNKHHYTGIVCHDQKTALWCATRFRKLHSDPVWKRMSKNSGAKTIEEYAQQILDFSNMIETYAHNTIELNDIINGNAIQRLEKLTTIDVNARILYDQWIEDVVTQSD